MCHVCSIFGSDHNVHLAIKRPPGKFAKDKNGRATQNLYV